MHPGAQLRLSFILTKNHTEIRELISKSAISLYSVELDLENFKAFKGVSFRELDVKRSQVAQKKPFVLAADISRFFYTIYTHSIAWAVLGKENVKGAILSASSKKRKKHWTDELDQALQACQSRETFGIPVGPDTSRVIAEILLCGVHSEAAFLSASKASAGFRLVDDFFLGFDDEEQCKSALIALRNALAIFNLQLNDDKTSIRPSKKVFTDRWRYELLRAPLKSGDQKTEALQMRRIAELAYYHADKIGNAFPVKWLATRMLHTNFNKRNFPLALRILTRFGRDFPVCINLVATYIINHKIQCLRRSQNIEIIKSWIKSVFGAHSQNSNDFEVSWALVVCGALKIEISKADFGDYKNSMSSVAFALLGLLNEKKLLRDPLSKFEWRGQVKNSGLDSHHWLMFYESVLRKWTNDPAMVAAVKSHSLFGDLLKKKISFLDDSVFGDVQINLSRRRLRRMPPKEVAFASSDDADAVEFDESDSFGLGSI